MKHNLKITLIIVFFFMLSQIIGLLAVNNYIDIRSEEKTDIRALPASIERPEVEKRETPWLILGGLLLGTILVLLLIKTKAVMVWNAWFFMAVFLLAYISLNAFVTGMLALILAVAFGVIKSFNVKVHWIIKNIPELFLYAGLAVLFAPLLSIWGIIIILLLVSAYDAFAVWKSKHMIHMAKFQLSTQRFAGISFSYDDGGKIGSGPDEIEYSSTAGKKTLRPGKVSKIKEKGRTHESKEDMRGSSIKRAILGGGDMAFPLLFSSVVLLYYGWFPALLTVAGSLTGLFILLYLSEKEKFYPAMPFITSGLFLSYGLAFILFI